MKKLILVIALVVILPVLMVSDTSASPRGSYVPDNELTTSQAETSNSSASATITIKMYTVDE